MRRAQKSTPTKKKSGSRNADVPIRSFKTQKDFAGWLEKNHTRSQGILLRVAKKNSGVKSVTYPEALETALCFGWIDGTEKGIDKDTFAGRFTPRRAKSNWSESNRIRVARLLSDGKMTEAGLAVLPVDLRPA